MIRFHVITIFPEVFPGPLAVGVVGRALAASDVELAVHDLRAHTEGRHRQVDDEPFGGGAGMVLKPEPLIRAVRAVRDLDPEVRCILLSPQGRRFDQGVARELASGYQINAAAFACDITDGAAVAGLVGQVTGRFGRLDILVNDAATNTSIPFTDLDALTLEGSSAQSAGGPATRRSRICAMRSSELNYTCCDLRMGSYRSER